jgi:integrase
MPPSDKLTDAAVRTAKAKAGERLELWDAQKPGLCLRVTDQGRKTWVLRYRTVDGRQPRMTLGTYPALKIADARELADDALRSVRRGGDPAGEKRKAKVAAKAQPVKSLEDLARVYFLACETGEWCPRGKQKRASTIEHERDLWKRLLSPSLGKLRVEDAGPSQIRAPLREIAKTRPASANRVRAVIRQMFTFAIAEGRIELNPVSKVAAPAADKPRVRVLADSEIKLAWSALLAPQGLRKLTGDGEEEGERVYLGEAMTIAVRLLFLTLTRRAEVAGMRWDELDLAQAGWTIPSARTKNGKPLFVALSDAAVELLKRAKALAMAGRKKLPAHVFPSPRDSEKAITPGAVSHAIRDLRECFDVPRFTVHDLRRTAATIMASERLGVSPFLIGRLLNHSSETGGAAQVTLTHYALHQYAVEKRAALQAWADLLSLIVSA